LGLTVEWVTFDANDPVSLAQFWCAALDYEWLSRDGDEEILIAARDGSRRRILFVPVPEAKERKNRLHLDLRPTDLAWEVSRLEALGAARADVGQAADAPWVVMTDPEGNEFCVLRALSTEERARVPFAD
jgi:hypothetical protein